MALYAANSYAQFGIKAGIGVSYEYNNLINTYSKTGGELSCFYYVPMSKFPDIRIDLGYKQSGYVSKLMELVGTVKSDVTKYQLLTFGPDLIIPFNSQDNKIYLYAGIRINYLLASDFAFENQEVGFSEDYRRSFSKIQYMADAGIGVNVTPAFFIEIGSNGNFINKINRTKSTGSKAYDYYFGITLGYKLTRNSTKS